MRDAKKSHSQGFLHWVEERYMGMLRWSLAHRLTMVMICLVTFLSTFGLYHLVGRDWIPADDQSELQSSFTLPEGTSLAKTSQIASDMARQIPRCRRLPSCRAYTHGLTNHAHLFIGLVPRNQRKFTHAQMATKVRGILANYHNVTYNVRLPSVLGGEIYFPISAVIRGPDLNQLAEISKKIAEPDASVSGSGGCQSQSELEYA